MARGSGRLRATESAQTVTWAPIPSRRVLALAAAALIGSVFTPAAFAAGKVTFGVVLPLSGAALAEISDFAWIDMLGFERSADAMIMTAIGGSGSRPGVVLGAALYAGLEDRLSAINPEYWRLGLGLAMMASAFVFPRGLADLASLRRGRAR